REGKKEKVAPYQESHLTASYRLRALHWRWRRHHHVIRAEGQKDLLFFEGVSLFPITLTDTFTGLILFLSPHSSRLRPSRTPTPNDRLSTVPVSCAEMT
ncbi:hypothetical protein N7497_007421, partial [Penicillium chrysogenum]